MSSDSHRFTREKFDSKEYAALYAGKFAASRKDAREKECIRELLLGVLPGSRVLDLPCGAGRMTSFLVRLGHRVTAADTSEHMLAEARARVQAELGPEGLADRVELSQQDILKLGFDDDAFDAVACNRLFHHFAESETRRRALAELARVCRGPIVVSYFSSFALSALQRRVANAVRGIRPVDRIPVAPRVFRADVQAAGLVEEACLPVRWGISPQTYLRLRRARRG